MIVVDVRSPILVGSLAALLATACVDPPPAPPKPIVECEEAAECSVLREDRGYSENCTIVQCVEKPREGAPSVIDWRCEFQAVNEGLACDDGNGCTLSEVCGDKRCTGEAKACVDGHPCTADGVCDPATGKCDHALLVGIPCDDGVACTEADVCDEAGLCVGEPGEDCECEHNTECAPLGESFRCGCNFACVDDAAATSACDAKTGSACARAYCNPETGLCGLAAVNNGAPCTSANLCVTNASCVEASCLGTPKPCDDGDACTADACQSATGQCAHGAPCDDGDPATADCCTATGCQHPGVGQACPP